LIDLFQKKGAWIYTGRKGHGHGEKREGKKKAWGEKKLTTLRGNTTTYLPTHRRCTKRRKGGKGGKPEWVEPGTSPSPGGRDVAGSKKSRVR